MKETHRRPKSGSQGRPGKRPAQQLAWTGIEHVCRIEKLVPGGLAMARYEGQVVFVAGALPGELVSLELSAPRGGYRQARLKKIIETVPERRAAPCALYGQCGGCNLQHATEAAQLAYRRGMLEDCLRRQGGYGLERPLPPIESVEGPAWEYRCRQQYHRVPPEGGPGFREREGERIVAVADCPVASPEIRAWLRSKPRLAPAPLTEREAQDTEEGGRYPVFGCQGKFGETAGELSIELGGREFRLAVEGFFQSNVALLPALLERVRGWVAAMGPLPLVWDLYAGGGLFSAYLPENCREIVAVDNNPDNMRIAAANTRGAAIRLVEDDVDRFVAEMEANAPRPDLVIVDPPRTGLSPTLLKCLLALLPPQLISVSCDPVTFSRDLKALMAAGYQVAELVHFDFYPQTSHIETACRLVLARP